MALIPTINKTAQAGTPRAKEQYIFVLQVEDIATFPVMIPDKVLIAALPTLLPSKSFTTIYATGKTISVKDEVSGEVDAKGFMTTVSFAHPGDEQGINDFAQANVNKGAILLSAIKVGDSYSIKVAGTPSNPLYLSLEEQDDSEAVKKTFTYKQEQADAFKTQIFVGELPVVTPPAKTAGVEA